LIGSRAKVTKKAVPEVYLPVFRHLARSNPIYSRLSWHKSHIVTKTPRLKLQIWKMSPIYVKFPTWHFFISTVFLLK